MRSWYALLPSWLLNLDLEADLATPSPPHEVLTRIAIDAGHGKPLPATLAELGIAGFPTELLEQLAALVENEGHAEADIVRVCIAMLARSGAGAALSTNDRAVLAGTVMAERHLRSARAALQPLLADVTVTSWEDPERLEL